jgi:hypothetical protein
VRGSGLELSGESNCVLVVGCDAFIDVLVRAEIVGVRDFDLSDDVGVVSVALFAFGSEFCSEADTGVVDFLAMFRSARVLERDEVLVDPLGKVAD